MLTAESPDAGPARPARGHGARDSESDCAAVTMPNPRAAGRCGGPGRFVGPGRALREAGRLIITGEIIAEIQVAVSGFRVSRIASERRAVADGGSSVGVKLTQQLTSCLPLQGGGEDTEGCFERRLEITLTFCMTVERQTENKSQQHVICVGEQAGVEPRTLGQYQEERLITVLRDQPFITNFGLFTFFLKIKPKIWILENCSEFVQSWKPFSK